jgi:hypothetical protein
MVPHEPDVVDLCWDVSITFPLGVDSSSYSASRTTFFSVIFAIINSLRLQSECHPSIIRIGFHNTMPEFVGRAISDYLTSETGVTIIFESAIVPKWKDSAISFKNVYISRRPPPSTVASIRNVGHMAAVGYDVSNHPAYHRVDDELEDDRNSHDTEFNNNWSMFDLNVDSIDVTLSLRRWFDGKGLVKDAVVKGVRGVLGEQVCFPLVFFLAYHPTLRQAHNTLGPLSNSRPCYIPSRTSTWRFRARIHQT